MAIEFTRTCDIGQGYNFKQDEHHTFGYINSFALGDNNIAPDIKVVEPAAVTAVAKGGNAGTGSGFEADTSGIFTKPVVAVLEEVGWSTLPNENITLKGRISVQNASQLNSLAMQSLKRVVITLSFVVYRYDLVAQKYFTHFMSWAGTAPKAGAATKGGGAGFGDDSVAKPIHALLGKTSGTEFGLKVGADSQEDPLGIQNYTLELTLAPPIASSPQKILIQTSETIKLIQPWGIPQN